MSITTNDEATSGAAVGSRPFRMHHNAFVTSDLEQTRRFYEEVIGLPMTATWAEVDQFPDRERVYCHCFFELSDGSALAFFQFQAPELEVAPVPQPCTSIHLALSCDAATQRGIHERLRTAGYGDEEVSLKDHGYCVSLYVRDPNGLRLEFTVDIPEMPEIAQRQRETAHDTLRRWLAGDHSSNNEWRPQH